MCGIWMQGLNPLPEFTALLTTATIANLGKKATFPNDALELPGIIRSCIRYGVTHQITGCHKDTLPTRVKTGNRK